MSLTVGSLFSGIGGFDKGLQDAGMKIRWQVEINEWCRKVLTKHWLEVPKYGDIRALDWSTVAPVDLLCGGFPCQPFSVAGKRQGADDDRNMWPEFRRAVAALKPRWVLGENVSGAKSYIESVVLPDLEALGYETAVLGIPACAVGAPHRRERLWIVGYSTSQQWSGKWETSREQQIQAGRPGARSEDVAHAKSQQARGILQRTISPNAGARSNGTAEASSWAVEPNVGRVAHGVPHRVDRLRGLGNAVVPQIVEHLGHLIQAVEQRG